MMLANATFVYLHLSSISQVEPTPIDLGNGLQLIPVVCMTDVQYDSHTSLFLSFLHFPILFWDERAWRVFGVIRQASSAFVNYARPRMNSVARSSPPLSPLPLTFLQSMFDGPDGNSSNLVEHSHEHEHDGKTNSMLDCHPIPILGCSVQIPLAYWHHELPFTVGFPVANEQDFSNPPVLTHIEHLDALTANHRPPPVYYAPHTCYLYLQLRLFTICLHILAFHYVLHYF